MSAPREARSSAGRSPWVTFGLLAVCVAVLAHDFYATRGLAEAIDSRLGEAADYFESHPYLEPPGVLAQRLGETGIRLQRRRFQEERDRRGAPPIPEGVVRRRQETLEEMVSASLEGFDARPLRRWGFRVSEKRPATLLSHVFFHSGWIHLLGNAFFLVVLAFYLESTWGAVLYTALLLAAAPAAATAFGVARPEAGGLLIGTSALVASQLGAFALRFRHLWREGVWSFLLVSGAVWLLLPVWLGIEWSLAAGFQPDPLRIEAPGASYWIYGVGFGVGVLTAGAFQLFRFEEALVNPSRDAKLTRVANPLLEQAVREQSEGRLERAFTLLSRCLREHPHDCDAALAMWDVANALARPADAARAMLRVIREEIRRRDHAAAVEHWLELESAGLSADAEVSLLIKMATLLRTHDQKSAALAALRRALQMADGSTVVASRVAQAAMHLDTEVAEEAAWRALGSVELEYEERHALEEMLGELYEERSFRRRSVPRARRPEPPASPAEPAAPDAASRAGPIEIELGSRRIQVSTVRPLALQRDGLSVETPSGAKRILDLARVEAIAVAAVSGLSAKPVIVLDLVLNWTSPADEPLRVARLRGDRFDPRRLVAAEESSPLEALRVLLERLFRLSSARPLPDLDAARGTPFAAFESLAAYERVVLMVDEPSSQ